MKTLNLFIVLGLLLGLDTSCSAQPGKDTSTPVVSADQEVEVFYFHYTRRCVTCQAVETVSGEALVELFGERVPFKGFNLDEADGKQKATDLGVSGQTLLIVSGDKKINITNEGFMYARSNPDKLKQVISDNVTPLL
ncbi:MAG: nitrophenyl compound nitroreductase subunit ArsF family protein [Bacteroidota bacterium]